MADRRIPLRVLTAGYQACEAICDPADLGGLYKICMGVICEHCVGKVVTHGDAKSGSNDFGRWFDECK
jgi:hypothetical protein